jgi:hypothetical protein
MTTAVYRNRPEAWTFHRSIAGYNLNDRRSNMAKAKKTESSGEASKKSAAKKGAATKTAETKAAPTKSASAKTADAKKSARPAHVTSAPLIDTNLAAQAAAQMLAAGLNKPVPASAAPKQESAMFKQLKAGLNKPHSTTMTNLLDKSHGPEPTRIHPQQKQIGKNQTFGADVTRSGVPRRTPG